MLAALFYACLTFPLNVPAGLALGALGMAMIGLLDDWRPFTPSRKFALTVLVAIAAVVLGLRFEWTDYVWVDGALTALWLIWMCHAFNVLDMADGLSAGVGAIAAASLWFMGAGDWAVAVAGALVGFLLHNTPPARVYMGDAGSLMFGFLLGGGAVLIAPGGWMEMISPFVALGVMTFEAVFISVMRFAKGRPISRASRDHMAQRLFRKSGTRVPRLPKWIWLACLWLGILGTTGIFDVLDMPRAWWYVLCWVLIAIGLAHRVYSPGEVVLKMWYAGILLGALGVWISWEMLPPWVGLSIAFFGAWLAGYALERVDMEGDGVDGRPAGLFAKNWLVHRFMRQTMEQVAPLARGHLLDVGCGTQPYRRLFDHVSRYTGMDRDRTRYARADLWADALALPMRSNACDTVLCNQVLEHVPEPQQVMNEMARVLRPGGTLILTAPHIWGLHEIPHDYYRYTPYGLRHLTEKAGLSVVEIRAMAGFWVTAGARFCYYLAHFDRGILKPIVRPAFFLTQLCALALDRLHRVESDAWNFLLIAKK